MGLPDGWVEAALDEVCEVNPRRAVFEGVASRTQVTFVPMAAVDAASGTIAAPEVKSLSEVAKGYTAFRNEDVILAKITPCFENGKAAVAKGLANNLGFGSTEFHVLRTKGAVLPQYVFHYVRQQQFRETAAEEMTGTVGQKRLPAAYLRQLVLPIPPIAEQGRIVAAVEALVGRVDAVRGRLSEVSTLLRRFRQAVLAAACSGGLTQGSSDGSEGEREESAQDLIRALGATGTAMLGSTEESEGAQELPDTWGSCPFGLLANNYDGRRVPVKSADREKRRGPYPYYGASGVIDTIDAYLFDGEYLLIAEDGANLLSRSTPIAFRAAGRFWVNNHAHVVQPKSGIVLGFLEIFLNSLDLQHFVTGTAQPKLTQAALNGIAVPLPPTTEQSEIVRRVEALRAVAETIEKRVAAASVRAARLPQAILGKAFSGELLPTEAELSRREGREYESAGALLSRLAAELQGEIASCVSSASGNADRASNRRSRQGARGTR